MPQELLECGQIVGVHGVLGELKLKPWGDDAEHLCNFSRLFDKKTGRQLDVIAMRIHKGMALVRLEGISTREQAESMRGTVLCIAREDDELAPGQYYWSDIMGLSVEDIGTGEVYGTISDISDTGANLVYHIQGAEGRVLLIPAIPQVVREISLQEKRMLIQPLDGLFD